MKPYDFIITQNQCDRHYTSRPWFQDQTLELARSLARAGFKTLFLRIMEEPEYVKPEVHSTEDWASLTSWDIKPPVWAKGHLKPFAIAQATKKAIAQYSRRLTTLVVTGSEGAFLRKLKSKKRLVYFQTPDLHWPEPSERDWTKVGDWLETLIWDPQRVALAMTIHAAFEVVVSTTHQLHRLQDNFFIPPHKGEVALPVIDPQVSRDLIYEPQGQQALLFIGENPMEGGLDLLLEAWNEQEDSWKREHPLMVVSKVKSGTNLAKWIDGLKPQGLEFIEIDELDASAISELILQSRLVVLPSRVEEYGGFHLWTVALGANLLSTMVGATPDIIGQEAVLVETGDKDILAQALPRALVEVPEDRLYERRREYAWDNFNSQMRAHRFTQMFQAPEKIAGIALDDQGGVLPPEPSPET